MDETVYTPFEFFNLPYYLQRRILIEDLDFRSIENLCDAANEIENAKAKEFLKELCGSVEVWKEKFQYDFPRSFPKVNRDGAKTGAGTNIVYWKNKHALYKIQMPVWERDLIVNSKNGDLGRVEDLLELGVNPNTIDNRGRSALMEAAAFDHPEIVRLLLEAKAEVNIQSSNGKTALMWASIRGHTENVRMLLEAGVDVNIQNRDGLTALLIAVTLEHFGLVRLLLEAGADPNFQEIHGKTALMSSSVYNNPEVVRALLKAGADIDYQDRDGVTPLMLASDRGLPEIVVVLLNAGANPDVQNIHGKTALMAAVHRYDESVGNADVVWEIIRHKPDPDIQNDKGETAVDIAERNGLSAVVDALLYLRRMKDAL